MDIDTNVAVDGLSKQECGDFRLVCKLYDLRWSGFELHVEHGRRPRPQGAKAGPRAVSDLGTASYSSGGCGKQLDFCVRGRRESVLLYLAIPEVAIEG